MSEYKSNRKHNSGNTPANAISFLVESMINGKVNTMIPVLVVKVDASGTEKPVGRLSARPLVCHRDADGNALDMAETFELPYFRLQGGKVAIVADPVPGDIGIAIYSQSDSSNVVEGTKEPVQPGSFRKFSQSDGWYIGGFLNQAPETWVEMTQEGDATVHAPHNITIEAIGDNINIKAGKNVTVSAGDNVTVNAGSNVSVKAGSKVDVSGPSGITLNAPTIHLNGNVDISGDITGSSGSGSGGGDLFTIYGSARFTGRVHSDSDVTSKVSLNTHTHTCPEGETSGPH